LLVNNKYPHQRKTLARVLYIIMSLLMFLIIFGALTQIQAKGFNTTGTYQWTEYKGSHSRTGFIENKWGRNGYIYRDYKIAWTFHADLCIASSPIIADLDGNGSPDLSFASCDGYEYAVDARNGTLLWKTRTGGGLVDPATWDVNGDGIPDVIVGGTTGNLFAINGNNGSIEWVIKGFYQRAIPTIYDVDHDGRKEIIATGMDGNLIVARGDGSIEKRISLGKTALTPAVVTVIDNKTYLVTADDRHLYRIDTETWKTKTLGTDQRIVTTTPVITGNGSQAIIVGEKSLIDIDLENMTILWEAKYEGSGIASPSVGEVLNTGREQIVFGTDQGLYIYAVNGSLLRVYHDVRMGTASPIIFDIDNDGKNEIVLGTYDGDIIIAQLDNNITVADATEWELSTGAPIMAPPAIGDGDKDGMPEIYIGSRDYNLYCIDGVPGKIGEKEEYNTSTETNVTQLIPTTATQTSIETTVPPKINTTIIVWVAGLLTAFTILSYIYYRKK
jgi:outer membrane protein assembly factor BamB